MKTITITLSSALLLGGCASSGPTQAQRAAAIVQQQSHQEAEKRQKEQEFVRITANWEKLKPGMTIEEVESAIGPIKDTGLDFARGVIEGARKLNEKVNPTVIPVKTNVYEMTFIVDGTGTLRLGTLALQRPARVEPTRAIIGSDTQGTAASVRSNTTHQGQSATATAGPGKISFGPNGMMRARYSFTGEMFVFDSSVRKAVKVASGMTVEQLGEAAKAAGVSVTKLSEDSFKIGDTILYFKNGKLSEQEG